MQQWLKNNNVYAFFFTTANLKASCECELVLNASAFLVTNVWTNYTIHFDTGGALQMENLECWYIHRFLRPFIYDATIFWFRFRNRVVSINTFTHTQSFKETRTFVRSFVRKVIASNECLISLGQYNWIVQSPPPVRVCFTLTLIVLLIYTVNGI